MTSDAVLQYMIIVLGIIALCIMFSTWVRRLLVICIRGSAGLLFISLCGTFLGGFGAGVGVNAVNGIIIGILGLPALIGLYILDIFF